MTYLRSDIASAWADRDPIDTAFALRGEVFRDVPGRKTQRVEIDGVEIMFPVEANAVFANLPKKMEDGMRAKGWRFYNFIGAGGSRLMCSWDTGTEDVEAFLADCRELTS